MNDERRPWETESRAVLLVTLALCAFITFRIFQLREKCLEFFESAGVESNSLTEPALSFWFAMAIPVLAFIAIVKEQRLAK